MRMLSKISALAMAGALMAGSAFAADAGGVVNRRLSPEQYRTIIADIFGTNIKIGGRFDPEIRENGLLAVGSGHASMTGTALERFDGMARTIAGQVVDEDHRRLLVGCKPAQANAPDEACTKKFIAKVGRLLYRRPMTANELQAQVAAAAEMATTLKDFYAGLGLSLAGMLESPQFLFREEVAEADPDHTAQYRLDAFSKASQLSFLLWNAGPDDDLLAAAESGEINTQKGLAKQVDRMLASPRVESGVRAFFGDMLGFDQFDTLTKDATLYPKFTPQAAADAQEQTMRTIVDLVLARHGDYRDVFTTRKTFLTPILGSIYGVPVPKGMPNVSPDDWRAIEYPENDPRAGILMQVSFVALHAHPGRSSPTIRGKALRELLLCQRVPDPPANVNFTIVQDTKNPTYKTARERLTAHRTNPACAGCHKLIDPMGLALENFDSAGGYRATENGAPIDASGELDGIKFADATGLGRAVHDNPATSSCLVNRLYSYAAGRVPSKGETEWMRYLDKSFAADGYRFDSLLRRIATSEALYRVSAPQTGAANAPSPKLATSISPQESGK